MYNSSRCGKARQTRAIGDTGFAQSADVFESAVKGTKLKTEAMELLGKLAPTIKPCSNHTNSLKSCNS
jgi:hypothetical protein